MTWKEAEKIAKEKLGVGDDYVMYGYKLLGSEGILVVMLDKKKDGKWAYEDIKCEIPLR